MPTPEEIEALILDAQSITGPCQRYENGSLRTYYAGYNLTELAKRISATYDAIPEREREIERLRLLSNTDITELSDERDALRARVAELEAALRKVLEAVIAYLPDQPPKTGRAKTSI